MWRRGALASVLLAKELSGPPSRPDRRTCTRTACSLFPTDRHQRFSWYYTGLVVGNRNQQYHGIDSERKRRSVFKLSSHSTPLGLNIGDQVHVTEPRREFGNIADGITALFGVTLVGLKVPSIHPLAASESPSFLEEKGRGEEKAVALAFSTCVPRGRAKPCYCSTTQW